MQFKFRNHKIVGYWRPDETEAAYIERRKKDTPEEYHHLLKINKEDFSYPWPVSESKKWKGKKKNEFLRKLFQVEQKAKEWRYSGHSNCRFCSIRNGSGEFDYKNFLWPSGYSHYIEEHDVFPDLDFYNMIMNDQ